MSASDLSAVMQVSSGGSQPPVFHWQTKMGVGIVDHPHRSSFNGFSSSSTGAAAFGFGKPGVIVCDPGMFFPKLRLPLTLVGLALALPQAKAAITITFSFDGTDTLGVISGSIVLPAAPATNDNGGGYLRYVGRGAEILYVHVVGSPSYDHYTGGSNPGFVNLRAYPTPEFIGTKSFGFDRGSLYTAYDAVPGSTYAPTGTFVWPYSTLEQVGVAGLTTPLVVYVASNGEEIRFVTNVPEPGVTGLLAAGAAFGAIGVRRRGR